MRPMSFRWLPKGLFFCNNKLCVCVCAADAWHKRLVRYYSYFGFERVRAVGDNGLRDLPDLLVWGGVGEQTFHTTCRCPCHPFS